MNLTLWIYYCFDHGVWISMPFKYVRGHSFLTWANIWKWNYVTVTNVWIISRLWIQLLWVYYWFQSHFMIFQVLTILLNWGSCIITQTVRSMVEHSNTTFFKCHICQCLTICSCKMCSLETFELFQDNHFTFLYWWHLLSSWTIYLKSWYKFYLILIFFQITPFNDWILQKIIKSSLYLCLIHKNNLFSWCKSKVHFFKITPILSCIFHLKDSVHFFSHFVQLFSMWSVVIHCQQLCQ